MIDAVYRAESRCVPKSREPREGGRPMAQRLPELKALKGRHRAYSYFGETTGPRFKEYLTDYEVVTDPDELEEEGPKHRRHNHLIFSNCVANVGKGLLLLEFTRRSRTRATVEQLIE